MTKFVIKGEILGAGDLDQFDTLLALLEQVRGCETVEIDQLRGTSGDVKLRISRTGEWSDG